jgi:ESCRT-I complex subunit TSG101
MPSLDPTRDWLKNVLRPYPSHERILNEVLGVLASQRTLQVKTDAFSELATPSAFLPSSIFFLPLLFPLPRSHTLTSAFDSGQTALLLLLHGTLPINYRGATYQIPINVWVPHDYPQRPPMAFVVPTKEMGVRKSREVDPGGRVREEVVEHWWASWPVSEQCLPQTTVRFADTKEIEGRWQAQLFIEPAS